MQLLKVLVTVALEKQTARGLVTAYFVLPVFQEQEFNKLNITPSTSHCSAYNAVSVVSTQNININSK